MSFAFIVSSLSLLASFILLLLVNLLLSLCAKMLLGVRFATIFHWGLLLLILPPIFALYGYFIGRNNIKVNRVAISSETLPETFSGYRVVHISDLHLESFEGRESLLNKIVERINALNPDLILFTGDLVTLRENELYLYGAPLKGLRAKDGVFSVLGNHDYLLYNRWSDDSLRRAAVEKLMAGVEELGWRLLNNSNFIIKRGADSLSVVGVENHSTMKHFPSRGELSTALEGTGNSWKILMSHDPTHWRSEVLGKENIPLTLSGHTHSFQFSLLSWSPSRYLYKEYKGLYSEQGQYLYVNRGLGETLLPIRIGVPKEITLIELHK